MSALLGCTGEGLPEALARVTGGTAAARLLVVGPPAGSTETTNTAAHHAAHHAACVSSPHYLWHYFTTKRYLLSLQGLLLCLSVAAETGGKHKDKESLHRVPHKQPEADEAWRRMRRLRSGDPPSASWSG